MKIVCDSCGAKYSIADEKVAGRVFKIRCKKCGAAIVVRGDQQGGSEAQAPAASGYDYGSDAVWHAVVDGDQQGPFSPAQIGAMIAEGRIGWDAYVWREGFDDWKPAQDVEELVQAIMNPGAAPQEPAPQEAAQPDPFAGSEGVAARPSQRPAAAKAGRNAGADLFAPSATSPFGGSEDDDVVSSAPSPRVTAQQAMTGQRNENSVLFSLSNLQALATGAPGGASAQSKSSGAKPGMASGEGSGLIDIRALASATGLGTGGSSSSSSGPPKVDDLLSIGAPTVGLGSALAAPVIIAEKTPEKSGNGLLIGAIVVGVSVVAAAGIVAAVLISRQPDPAAASTPTALAPGATPPAAPIAASAVAAVAPGASTPAPAAATSEGATAGTATITGSGSASSTLQPTAPGAEATTTQAPGAGTPAGASAASGGRRSGRGSSAGAPAAAPSAPSGSSGGGSSGTSSGSSSGGRSSSSERSIDDLLESVVSGGGRRSGGGSGGGGAGASAGGSSASSGAPPGAPETPSRSDVVAAMSAVQSAVAACGNGEHGTATVAVTVSGATGRVTEANVSGQFAGTPVGSCIARAVRGATFPRFTRPTFTVNYPFRI